MQLVTTADGEMVTIDRAESESEARDRLIELATTYTGRRFLLVPPASAAAGWQIAEVAAR